MPDQKLSHVERVLAVCSDRSASSRSALAASWSRSAIHYGRDPNETRPPAMLTTAELRAAQDRLGPLLGIAQPSIDSLFMTVGGAGCCVLFTDHHGVPVVRRGAPVDDPTFQRWGLWPGAVWSEQSEGTNAIGTCIAERRPMTIFRDQHFHTRNTGLSCFAAPVYDQNGQLAAVVDVSTCRSDVTEGLAPLVAAAVAETARRIEAQNFRHSYAHARIILTRDHERSVAGLVAVDEDDLVIGATRAARLAFGLTNEQLAQKLPANTLLGIGTATGTGDAGGARALDAAERGAVQRALATAGGNVSAAAKSLGISRATLHRKLNRLGLHQPPAS